VSLYQISSKSVKLRPRYCNFSIFQDGGRRHLDFQNCKFLTVGRLKRDELLRCVKFGRNQSNHCRDMTIFQFFQDGGRPPSWICSVSDWTTHEGRLVVFITVQNLVGIDAVVSIICKF